PEFSTVFPYTTLFRSCHTMILSDALPVQFWLSDCETFNETQAGGVHPLCWCQPFNCDDDINIQFQDDAGSEFLLQIFDTNDALIDRKSTRLNSSHVKS